MKKRLAVLLLLFLCLHSWAGAEEAYTIDQVRQQAAAGWRQTYEAYGRTIVADVEAVIPEVHQVPIERLTFARTEPAVTEEETGLTFIVRPEENVFAFATGDFIEIIPQQRDKKNDGCIGHPREWNRAYAQGNSLTLQETVDIIREALSVMRLDVDNWDLEHPYELATFRFFHPKTKEIAAPGEYMIYFHQKVNGIPLLNHAGATFYQKTRGNATIRLNASVIDRDMYDISAPMLKPIERIADDVPLCGFSKIIEAAEREILAGHIRKIYHLEFGYLFYEDPDCVSSRTQTDHFYAVPAWQLSCLYMSNPRKELPEYGQEETGDARYSLEYACLTIDAQTGEIRDFMSQKKDRALYHGFLSWEDVR